MMLPRLIFLSIFFLKSLLLASTSFLSTGDVQKVMDQLFDYHIEEKKIASHIVERSLKIYVEQFDPYHSYFVDEEIDHYLKPSKPFIQRIMNDYEKDNYSAYFLLNEKIKGAILRARGWRYEWESDPKELVARAKLLTLKEELPKSYPSTVAELKKNHEMVFLKLLRIHLDELPQTLPSGKEGKLVALCEKKLALIENQYLCLNDQGNPLNEEEKEHAVVMRTLKALAHSLDAHTSYYSPEEAYAMKVQLEKGMCGIGVVLHEGIEGVVIADIIKGGPAEKTKQLQVGDTIKEVDGESVSTYSFQKVLEVMRGKEGTKMTLGVVRETPRQVSEFYRYELIREKMVIEDKRVDVSFEPFGDGIIGKITLHSFYEGEDGVSSEKDIKKAIEDLREQGHLYGLVLDMRDNCGGFLSQAVKVSGLFISSGVVVISKYSDGTVKYYRSIEGKRFYDGPLVVLVSKGSASATEIVAQTLQDYGVAVVVGDPSTYGKGTIQHQTVTGTTADSFFKVTIGRYYTVSGKSTQVEGVKADIVVPTATGFEEIGEGTLDYPIPPDQVAPAFVDSLEDLDPYARKWFAKYYLPTLQPQVNDWADKIVLLKENSKKRLELNSNFQLFLKTMIDKGEFDTSSLDLQMEESVNIVKDMIYLKDLYLTVGP